MKLFLFCPLFLFLLFAMQKSWGPDYIPKGLHGIEFWRPWNAKMKYTNRITESFVQLSCLLWNLYSGHWNVKNGTFFVFSMDNGEMFWAKCLSAPGRSYWVLSESGRLMGFWSYRSWDIEDRNIKNCWISKNTKIIYFQRLTSC